TERFERYRLTAGVRAGDDKGVIVASDGDVDGYSGLLIEQRMTGTVQIDRVVLGQVRLAGIQLKRQLGACENKVESAQRLIVLADGFRALCHAQRQLGENALDLLLLASLEYLELVVDLDDLCRLDKQRRARTRGVV